MDYYKVNYTGISSTYSCGFSHQPEIELLNKPLFIRVKLKLIDYFRKRYLLCTSIFPQSYTKIC